MQGYARYFPSAIFEQTFPVETVEKLATEWKKNSPFSF